MWTIVVILVVLWLLGYFGPRVSPRFPKIGGNWVHTLLVIALILIVLNLLGVI
jgi:hypothetical protein